MPTHATRRAQPPPALSRRTASSRVVIARKWAGRHGRGGRRRARSAAPSRAQGRSRPSPPRSMPSGHRAQRRRRAPQTSRTRTRCRPTARPRSPGGVSFYWSYAGWNDTQPLSAWGGATAIGRALLGSSKGGTLRVPCPAARVPTSAFWLPQRRLRRSKAICIPTASPSRGTPSCCVMSLPRRPASRPRDRRRAPEDHLAAPLRRKTFSQGEPTDTSLSRGPL